MSIDQAAFSRRLIIFRLEPHTSIKRSISVSFVSTPILTLMDDEAKLRERPIAPKTWLGPTFPDEQAAPELGYT